MSELDKKEQENTTNDQSFMQQFEPYEGKQTEEPTQVKPVKSQKQKRKELISNIFLFVLVFGLAAWNLFSGISGLFFAKQHNISEIYTEAKKGEAYSGKISYASTEYVSLKHSINFIPIGTEHFYIIFSEDLNSAFVVRANKKWMDGIPEELMNDVNKSGKGLVRKLDYKVTDNLKSLKSDLAEYKISLDIEKYLDLMSVPLCWLELASGIAVLLFVLLFRLTIAKLDNLENVKSITKGTPKKILGYLAVILFIALCISEIYLLSMAH